jgi:hypothetical protein
MSDSALNGAVLCKHCHAEVRHTREEHRQFFRWNLYWLGKQGYRANDNDKAFVARVADDIAGIELSTVEL